MSGYISCIRSAASDIDPENRFYDDYTSLANYTSISNGRFVSMVIVLRSDEATSYRALCLTGHATSEYKTVSYDMDRAITWRNRLYPNSSGGCLIIKLVNGVPVPITNCDHIWAVVRRKLTPAAAEYVDWDAISAIPPPDDGVPAAPRQLD